MRQLPIQAASICLSQAWRIWRVMPATRHDVDITRSSPNGRHLNGLRPLTQAVELTMPEDRFRSVCGVQLAHDALDMHFDGVLGNVKGMGDPLVGPSFLECFQHIHFPCCKDDCRAVCLCL